MYEHSKKKSHKKLMLALYILSLPLAFSACAVLIIIAIGGGGGGSSMEQLQQLELPGEYLISAQNAAIENNLDFITLLSMSAECYNGQFDQEMLNASVELTKQITVADMEYIAEIYDLYKKCYGAVKLHPIPLQSTYKVMIKDGLTKELVEITKTTQWTYSHTDDFGNDRTYGGERKHLGNDIMAAKGTPIVSMTDGVITQMGWNELGGWRLGITDENGTYWYYAHMSQYAEGMHQGLSVSAGTVIGYVGSSGYGSIGTTGKFADHLHLQIGIQLESSSEYLWINPYHIVVFMNSKRIVIGESR